MTTTTTPVNLLIATPLGDEFLDRIRAVDPRINVINRPDLLGTPTYIADHHHATTAHPRAATPSPRRELEWTLRGRCVDGVHGRLRRIDVVARRQAGPTAARRARQHDHDEPHWLQELVLGSTHTSFGAQQRPPHANVAGQHVLRPVFGSLTHVSPVGQQPPIPAPAQS